MIQIYSPYWEWEDYKNGMYETDISEERIQLSINLLSSPKEFKTVLIKLYNEWFVSADVNLSNKSCNRHAWLGQAACSYNHNGTELETRKAWSSLTNKQRYEANKVADIFIKKYERENSKLYQNLGTTLL